MLRLTKFSRFGTVLAVLFLAVSSRAVVGQSVEQLRSQAQSAYKVGNYADSERFCNQLLQMDSRDHLALYYRASARVEMGGQTNNAALVRKGIEDARAAIGIEEEPNYFLPYLYGMSQLSRIERKPEHASTALKTVDTLLSKSDLTKEQKANFYYQRALLDFEVGDDPQAEKDLRTAITLHPQHMAAHLELCDLLASLDKNSAAETQYNQLVTIFPSDPLIYNNRGTFLQSIGKYDAAIRDFDQAISLTPNYVPAWTNRGYAKLQQGQFAAAEKDLNESLKLDSKQPVALALRAATFLHRGRIKDAIRDYQAVVQMNPENPAAHYDLGFAYFFDRNYAAAREAFNSAQELDPRIPFLSPWRYTAMVFSGQRERAQQEFAPLLKKPKEERNWFDNATLFVMGSMEEDELLGSVAKEDDAAKTAQTCEAHYFIGLRRASRGDMAKAKEAFEEAIKSGQRNLSAYRGARYAIGKF